MMKKTAAFDVMNNALLILFTLMVIYPFWDLILISFARPTEASALGFHLWLKEWHLDAYKYIFSDSRVGYAYLNTLFRTIVGTFLTCFFTVIAAYPLSKKDLPGRSVITTYFIIPMFFSGGLIPFYLLMRSLGLIDRRMALILPSMVNVFYVIIMRNYMMTIDNSMEESAFMDGAGYFTILSRIIVPLSKPVIATVVLWAAVFYWNEWFYALILVRDSNKIVLQNLLRKLLQMTYAETDSLEYFQYDEKIEITGPTVRGAISVITIGPIVFLYPFIQRYFIKGIMIGALKG